MDASPTLAPEVTTAGSTSSTRRAARARTVRTSAPKWQQALTGARARAHHALARVPAWHAPHSWSDAGGLYADDQSAWLYQELPLHLLRAGEDGRPALDGLLARLAEVAPGRDVHVLLHAWDERVRLPHDLPGPLAKYLTPALSIFAPTRRLLIGVELVTPQGRSATSLRDTCSEVVERLLGEWVPDLCGYDTDRASIQTVLSAYGALAPTAEAGGHLESWYTLGAARNLEAVERDDVLLVDGTDVIEMTSVTALQPGTGNTLSALMSAGAHGATVASVRGHLMGRADGAARSDTLGSLTRVSIVLGRRSSGAPAPWAVDLRAFTGLQQRPLPMRQLQALEETLPCARVRVCPALTRITGRHLSLVGFADTERMGDDVGLFLGMGRPDFAQPTYLNPGRSAVTAVIGTAASGKTFLLEHLAAQAALAGQTVRYVTTAEDSSHFAGLPGLAGADRVPAGPGHRAPTSSSHAAADMVLDVLGAATPSLDEVERDDLRSATARAQAVGDLRVATVLSLCDAMSTVAKVRRSLGEGHPALAVLPVGADPLSTVEQHLVVTVPGTRTEEPARGDNLDLLVQDVSVAATIWSALEQPRPAGTLVLVDDVPGAGGRHTLAALSAAAAAPGSGVHVVLAGGTRWLGSPEVADAFAGNVILLGIADAAEAAKGLRLLGLDPTDARLQWLAAASPSLEDAMVARPALALHRDAAGRVGSLLVGPVPVTTLPALTRGLASAYSLTG